MRGNGTRRTLAYGVSLICGLLAAQVPTASAQVNQYANGIAAAKATATSPRDLRGVWVSEAFVPRFSSNPPYRPEAEAKFKAYSPANDPGARCLPSGWPRMMASPYPFEIFQLPEQTLMLFEVNNVLRRIWTDGRPHPEDYDPTWQGHSIGWWEGDVFVVDTVGTNDKQFLTMAGDIKSENLHTIERWKLLDGGKQIQLDITFEDDKVFTKPWSVTRVFQKTADEVMEFVCLENSRNNPDEGGLNYSGTVPYEVYNAIVQEAPPPAKDK